MFVLFVTSLFAIVVETIVLMDVENVSESA